MQHLNLNDFMAEVHQNAVAHGWWEKERSAGTVRSLFHCELSEAVEAYRNHEPNHWHRCPHKKGAACETMPVHEENLHCEACRQDMRKPEGVCVELIDMVIRVLDYLGHKDFVFPQEMDTAEKLAAWSLDDFQSDEVETVTGLELPDLVDVLHDEISLAGVMKNITYLTTTCGLVFAWVEKQGLDPVTLMIEKHKYNLTRSYKHGGKVC